MTSNLSKIRPKLRTQGRVTGNFGRNRVEGKRGTLELSKQTLSKDNLKVPSTVDVYNRLREAYYNTDDAGLKRFLLDEIRKQELRKVTISLSRPPVSSEFWEEVKRVR
jgi:hypothetical protein